MCAFEGQLGVAVLRLELGHVGSVEVDLGLKRRLFEQVEQVAFFDLGTLGKQPLFEKRGDPGDKFHPTDRLDAADELVGLGDLLLLGACRTNRGRPGLGCCGNDVDDGQRDEAGGEPGDHISQENLADFGRR